MDFPNCANDPFNSIKIRMNYALRKFSKQKLIKYRSQTKNINSNSGLLLIPMKFLSCEISFTLFRMAKKFHFLLILLSINYTDSRDSLKHFIKNKSVTNFTIMYLGNETNWIEYNYYFKRQPDNSSTNSQITVQDFNNTLQVGLVLTKDKEFDCRIEIEDNETDFKGYSLEIVQLLKYL